MRTFRCDQPCRFNRLRFRFKPSSPRTKARLQPGHLITTYSTGNAPVGARRGHGNQHQHATQFCTQRCLLGLQQGGELDDRCPNVKAHRQGLHDSRRPITSRDLVQLLKQQLGENIDCNCTPLGACGASGAPFKLTCATYGYTVVGKGTASELWKDVSREKGIYQILWKAQGSAVPVFLGSIDLEKVYFLHGAGEIRHMLLMTWGGESAAKFTQHSTLRREIKKSKMEIRALGVIHQDLR